VIDFDQGIANREFHYVYRILYWTFLLVNSS